MKETKKIVKQCTDCGACVKRCLFLSHYCDSPKELAKRFTRNPLENIDIPYTCSLCGLCEKVCPENLNPGDMFLEIRQKFFSTSQGKALPQDFVYNFLITKLRGIKNHQIFSSSSFFTLSKLPKNYSGDNPKSVFFPGCSLPAYSPDLVLKTYKYLMQKIPGIAIVLNCCGKQSKDMGDNDRFNSILNNTLKKFSHLGIEEIVVACINCHKVLREHSHIKLRTVYEIIAEKGLDSCSPDSPDISGFKEVTIHDSCPARYIHDVQQDVRAIASDLGFQLIEMKNKKDFTECCGAGGCAPSGNRALTDRHTKKRTDQAKGQLVSYCAHCREHFSSYKPSLHILDLCFGTSDKNRIRVYRDSWKNWLNRWYLKKRLQIMRF